MTLDRSIYRGAVSAENGRRNISRLLEHRGHRIWTTAEDERLRSAFPDYKRAMRLLRGRTHYAIRSRAGFLGLTKTRRTWTTADLRKAKKLLEGGLTTKEIAKLFGVTRDSLAGALRHNRIPIPKRPLVPVKNRLLNAVRQRAQALNVPLAQLNRELRTKVFWKFYNTGGISERMAKRAARLLGGRMTIEWDAE